MVVNSLTALLGLVMNELFLAGITISTLLGPKAIFRVGVTSYTLCNLSYVTDYFKSN